jgi:hypothetical protein
MSHCPSSLRAICFAWGPTFMDERKGIQDYRTIWISDTHLGTPGAQAKALLHFLK